MDSRTSTQSQSKRKSYLPADFRPNAWCVLSGRGRECYESVGNRRFRVLVDIYLPRYIHATARVEKSRIVSEIVDTIHASNGGFVKFDHHRGIWYEVSDDDAREKVGNQFRVAMATAEGIGSTSKRRKMKAPRAEDTSGFSEESKNPSTSPAAQTGIPKKSEQTQGFHNKPNMASSQVPSNKEITSEVQNESSAQPKPPLDTYQRHKAQDKPAIRKVSISSSSRCYATTVLDSDLIASDIPESSIDTSDCLDGDDFLEVLEREFASSGDFLLTATRGIDVGEIQLNWADPGEQTHSYFK